MASPPKLITHLAPQQQETASSGEHTPTEPAAYKARGFGFFSHSHDDDHDDHGGASEFGTVAGSWWGDRGREGSRPWHNPPKRRKTIPPDQTVAFERTKEAVRKATNAVLRNARDVGHEGLLLAADALQLAPIMGLGEAARVLLSIWDSVEAVETNRMSCLRLTERCATILYSVRAEIGAAGLQVADILHDPVEKLTDSFRRVEHFIQKQVSRPFLKRYLKRDEDARKIMGCDAALTDSVGLFSVAIQIRMLKEVQAQGHAAHTAHTNIPPNPNEVLAAIATIRAVQAAHDAALDTADLYAAMRTALRMGSDVAMLDVLQVNRGEMAEAIKTLQRALEDPRLSIGRSAQLKTSGDGDALRLITTGAPDTPSSSGSGWSQYAWVPAQTWGATQTPAPTPAAWDPEQDAAFHREFLESGLDALRRVSGAAGGESLPPWTITRWEVDREGRIGMGFFSDVFKGVWRGRQVAIKILAPTTPRKLFRHETAIWASLKHPHVLELLGASSAAGDPPWFFVSPYMKNGTLVAFLKSVASGEAGFGRARGYPGPLQMMYEIAVGMAYLHRKGVLHGDLKANNVLIDDDLHCVISDFGQSELKSEVYRLSHQPQPHGTLRWQAPEILSGESVMTAEVDVYAFAIVCVEILTNGDLPWAMLDDQVVQQLVLRNNKRPKIPLRPETSLSLVTLIEQCWSTDPLSRPPFDTVARGLGHLEGGLRGSKMTPSPRGKILELIKEEEHKRSPDLAPIDLPPDLEIQDSVPGLSMSLESPLSDHTAESYRTPMSPLSPSAIPLQRLVTPSSDDRASVHHPLLDESVHENGSHPPRTLSPSPSDTFTTPEGSSEADHDYQNVAWDGYDSPPPRDERIAARRDERRYRLLLQHDFNPSLNLPLWDPSPVRLGAVGYLSKPSGSFVTLFNSYNPSNTGDGHAQGLPSIYGYGAVREAALRQDKRSVAQKGLDIIQGLLTFKKGGAGDGTFSQSVSRRHSFPLRSGHKHAYLCTENTMYRYMINMDAAKTWFKATIGEIVRLYGYQHGVQREDVVLVIGTLETRDYGLFVSHEHPDGQVHFNVFTDRREGQDWGSFSTDTGIAPSMAGPDFNTDGPNASRVHASRISRVRAGSDSDADAVLLARLRFKPDADEPTRL